MPDERDTDRRIEKLREETLAGRGPRTIADIEASAWRRWNGRGRYAAQRRTAPADEDAVRPSDATGTPG